MTAPKKKKAEEKVTEAEVEEAEETEDRAVILTVSNRFKRNRGDELCVTERSDPVEVKRFKTRPAVVKWGYGVTISQGNYEFVRVDIGVEVPCYPSDIRRAADWAKKFCEDKLREEVLSIQDGDDGIDDDGRGKTSAESDTEGPL